MDNLKAVAMKKLVTYLVLVFLLSTPGYYLFAHLGELKLNPFLVMFYLMWCPGLAGIITSLVYEKAYRL